ncbi:MAG: DUF432 domain-containing protein [Verrucomicrobiota bacterium]
MADFWQSASIPTGKTRHWEIGLLDLWIQHASGEWRIWHRTADESLEEGRYLLAQSCDAPDQTPQRRFASESSGDLVRLVPTFPDRPIVSYPGSPISVPAKSEAYFVCGIPLALEIYLTESKQAVPLISLPLRHLSKTWFGSPLAGEPCYSASTNAVLDHRELTPNKYRALCPVRVFNRSTENLPVERICIHVEHLHLYEGDEYLWSNEVSVIRENESDTSRVEYQTGPPAADPEAELIFEPRVEPPSRSMFLKTFNHFRSALSE